MKTFKEYLIECEIDDFYIDVKSHQDFYNKYNCNIHNKFPLLFQIHEAVILPKDVKRLGRLVKNYDDSIWNEKDLTLLWMVMS